MPTTERDLAKTAVRDMKFMGQLIGVEGHLASHLMAERDKSAIRSSEGIQAQLNGCNASRSSLQTEISDLRTDNSSLTEANHICKKDNSSLTTANSDLLVKSWNADSTHSDMKKCIEAAWNHQFWEPEPACIDRFLDS